MFTNQTAELIKFFTGLYQTTEVRHRPDEKKLYKHIIEELLILYKYERKN